MLGYAIVICRSDWERAFIAEAPNCPAAWRTATVVSHTI